MPSPSSSTSTRSQPPFEAATVRELAPKLGIAADALEQTIAEYNRACRPGEFKPLVVDGLATQGLTPRKSNWAHPLDKPPYYAYPVISSNVLTFGGLKVDPLARVLNKDGDPIRGLYAAGEIIGPYYHNYTGATSVLKGAVFGRIAGRSAARAALAEATVRA